MPGRLFSVTPAQAIGWAAHPRLAGYRVVVNMVHRSLILRGTLAERTLTAEQTRATVIACGFVFDLSRLELEPEDVARLRFSIGETDEWISPPDRATPLADRVVTVEDILVEAHATRSWVTGATYLDAAAAGLRIETIIDMLYRDYLGRPSDPHGLAHYAQGIRGGTSTYDDIRRSFLDAEEFRMRRKYLANAPGAIFSQGIVMAAAGEDAGQRAAPMASANGVPASELLRLDGPEFVTELYRRVLLKEPDEGGMAHYLHQLQLGLGKPAVIRMIAGDLEAITAGVRVIDDIDAITTGPAP